MQLLPYIELEIVDVPLPSTEERRSILRSSDLSAWQSCHLMHDSNGFNFSDYYFQVGFLYENNLVTTKDLISITMAIVSAFCWAGIDEHIHAGVQEHIEIYCERVNVLPIWGTRKFYDLVLTGRTIRTLEGPHKASGLRSGQRRQVILTEENEFAYGPLL